MEKKQGVFSALKDEVVRGLSPARSRAKSPARSASPIFGLLRRRKHHVAALEPLIAKSGSLMPLGETLTPLMEGPDAEGCDGGGERGEERRVGELDEGAIVESSVFFFLCCFFCLQKVGSEASADPLPHLSIKDTPIGLWMGIVCGLMAQVVMLSTITLCTNWEQEDGSCFKSKYKFAPYFYAAAKKMEMDVESYLRRHYEGQISDIEFVEKEDLDLETDIFKQPWTSSYSSLTYYLLLLLFALERERERKACSKVHSFVTQLCHLMKMKHRMEK